MNLRRTPLRPLAASILLLSLLALGACGTDPKAPPTTVAPSSAPESPAEVSNIMMFVQLSGKNEVPPNASTGTGSVDARLARRSNLLSWNISYSGLTGPLTSAHFHDPAFAGQNAGIGLALGPNLASPIVGSTTLTPEQAADLRAGKWYVNLHTAAYPNGEVRGQVVVKP